MTSSGHCSLCCRMCQSHHSAHTTAIIGGLCVQMVLETCFKVSLKELVCTLSELIGLHMQEGQTSSVPVHECCNKTAHLAVPHQQR